MSSEFSGSGPLRRFESIQEVDEEEYEDDVIEDDDGERGKGYGILIPRSMLR